MCGSGVWVTTDAFPSAAIGADGTTYIGFMDGRTYSIRDGAILSSVDLGRCTQGSPALAPGMMVATTCDGIHAFLARAPPKGI